MTADFFYKELQRLILSLPVMPLIIINCENCNNCNEVYSSKNLNYSFDSYRSTDCTFLFDSLLCDKCLDCDYSVESQLCYECVDAIQCFNSNYLEYCHSVSDSFFSYNCKNCKNIFGCVNLSNKSYCIFNRQLTPEEYTRQIKKYQNLPISQVLEMIDNLKKKFPVTQTVGGWNENTDYGNYIHNDKNCYMCFDAAYDENCLYLYDSFHNKNSMDLTYSSQDVDLSYEIVDSTKIFNCNFCASSTACVDSSYLFRCKNVKDSIGCVGLINKQYCILNRQLTKEEYEAKSLAILKMLNSQSIGWNNLTFR